MRTRVYLGILILLAFVSLLSLPAHAQFTTITATDIQAGDGSPLAAGSMCWLGTNNAGTPIGYRAGTSGQTITAPVCRDIVSGAVATTYKGVAKGALQVADTTLTQPANVCYKVTITDTSSGKVVLGSYAGAKSGYDCVQPSGSTWSFDTYTPAGTPGTLVTAGPQGPPGPASIPSMTEATALVTGTKPLSIAASGDSATFGIGLRDASTITVSTAPYISRDCAPTITATGSVSSVFCLQARPTYGGTGTVGTLAGLNFVPTVNGPVTKLAGVFVADALGSTNATTYNAVEVSTLTHCTTCRAFFAASNPSFFGGMTTHQAGITLGGNAAPLVANASPGGAGDAFISNGPGVTPSWTNTTYFPNRIGVGSNTPIADDNAFLAHRNITGAGYIGHGFRDESTVNATASSAYASFDDIITISGTDHYNHHIAFQGRPVYNGLGTIDFLAGANWVPTVNFGTVTNLYGYTVTNYTGAGTVGTQVGVYCYPLSGAATNYCIDSVGTTPSYFGGLVEFNTSGINLTGGAPLRISGVPGLSGQVPRSNGTGLTWGPAARASFGGYLNSGVTNGTQQLQSIKPEQPITAERISVNIAIAPAGCTSPTVVAISDGTNSASISIPNGTTIAESGSGAISDITPVNFGTSTPFTIKTTQTGCTTAPSGMNVAVHYKLQ